MIAVKVLAKIISLILLILCFYPMPFLYFTYEKHAIFGLFVIIIFIDLKLARYYDVFFSTVVATVFNPFVRARLAGSAWQLIDLWLIYILLPWISLDLILYVYKILKEGTLPKRMTFNASTGLFEITDAGYKYEIDGSLIESLKKYRRDNHIDLVSTWYATLNKEDKQKVIRSSPWLNGVEIR